MHVRTKLRELRGERSIREIAEASGVAAGTIRQLEQGRLLPLDRHVAPLEREYAAGLADWYGPLVLLALNEGDST